MRENNKYTKTTWLQKLLWPGGCFSQENGIGIFLASIAFGYTQGTPWVSQTRRFTYTRQQFQEKLEFYLDKENLECYHRSTIKLGKVECYG